MVTVAYDSFESATEFVVSVPLGGAKKESVVTRIEDHKLYVNFTRERPDYESQLNDRDLTLEHDGYIWGACDVDVDLPENMLYSDMHSKVDDNNILTVTIKKEAPREQQVPVE